MKRRRLEFDIEPTGEVSMLRGSYETPPGRYGTGSGGARFRTSVANVKGAVGRPKYVSRRVRATRDPVVQRQLRLGLTQWCEVSHESLTRLRGNVNEQYIQTYSTGMVDPYLTPVLDMAGDIAHGRLLREAAVSQHPSLHTQKLNLSVSSAASGVVAVDATPRTTWDMGTNWQIRDMMAYAYGLFTAETARSGYIPPFNSINVNNVITVQKPEGAPGIFGSNSIQYPRSGLNTDLSITDQEYATGTSLGSTADKYQYRLMQMQKRAPIHIKHESLTFSFQNPSETKQYIVVYECILKENVPLVEYRKTGATTTLAEGVQGIPIGVIPNPAELWKDYCTYVDVKGHTTHVPTVATSGAPYQEAIVDEAEALGASATTHGVHVPSELGSNNRWHDALAGVEDIVWRMSVNKAVTTPNFRPMGPLLTRWYKVIPHRITLEAGSRQSLTIKINYNGCPKWQDIMENYGVAGRTRAIMITINGERMFGSHSGYTAGGQSLSSVTARPDVLCRWKRHMKFCRYNLKPERMTLDIRVPTRTDISTVYQVDEEEGDIEQVGTGM